MGLNTLILPFVLVLVISCDRAGPHRPFKNGDVDGPTQIPDGKVVSYSQVLPIFERYCNRCHPELMPPDWTNYQAAKEYVDNGKLKQRVVIQKTMPLIGSPEAQEMTGRERELIAEWIEAGAPRSGDGVSRARGKEETFDSEAEWVAPEHFDEELMQRGAKLAEYYCFTCHVELHSKIDFETKCPPLFGVRYEYLMRQLTAFQNGERNGEVMPEVLGPGGWPLGVDEFRALSYFFSSSQESPSPR